MKKNRTISTALTGNETIFGICWIVISNLFLPSALTAGNQLLATPLTAVQLNFVYFCLNFGAVVWIFRRFLVGSWRCALKSPFPVLWYGALGYLGSSLLGELLNGLVFRLVPGFVNVNNQAIFTMLEQDRLLIIIGTVILVPVAEETLYRGVIFRNLYDRSPLWAHVLSIAIFAFIHVSGYIGIYSPVQLLIALLQYIPAGYCLCWVYCQTGTIAAPMLTHAFVNAMSIYYATR